MSDSKNASLAVTDHQNTYDFIGRHLITSYSDCNQTALCDQGKLVAVMKEAVQASGATLLHCVEHLFPSGGFTAVMLLAESHASIHTYPEHGACFVDLFTCGLSCNAEKFDSIMCGYLRPASTRRNILIRR